MNWAKQQLANVAGTQEPIYGPSAIASVAKQAETTPYTELTRTDLTWAAMNTTCVETQIFYLKADNGYFGLVQVIYINVQSIRTTAQFNSKIYYPDGSKATQWCSNPLSNIDFNEDKTSFFADDCALELSGDGNSYTVKSATNEAAIVNITVTRKAPGFQVGVDGKTLYGTDLANPWGSMRHAFWPRNTVEGTITTKDGPIDFKGTALFIHALQGMKPHHAAGKWNFLDFTGPKYSAVMMEFTTPASYGSTVVTVGGVVTDDEIITAGASNTVTHTKTAGDVENDWPEPIEVKYEWNGKSKGGVPVEAVFEGPLGERLDRVDVMAELPGFVKNIVAGVAGTKPYIYQYGLHKSKVSLKLKVGEEEVEEPGTFFSEATFIC